MAKLTNEGRDACPPWVCLRADGITCPEDSCDYEDGIYQGPVERWWLLADPDDGANASPALNTQVPHD